jgi:amino acid transporter
VGFLGVESIAVAAFEARSHYDIVYPALWVHWIIYAMYFFVTIGIVVSVWWKIWISLRYSGIPSTAGI